MVLRYRGRMAEDKEGILQRRASGDDCLSLVYVQVPCGYQHGLASALGRSLGESDGLRAG